MTRPQSYRCAELKMPRVTSGEVATVNSSVASVFTTATETLPSWVTRAQKPSLDGPTVDSRPSSHSPTLLIDVPTVADQLGVSVKTVRRLIKCKKLNACRVGRCVRINPEDLRAYIQRISTI